MKPYSKDLRQKIVDTYTEEKESIRQVAKRFKVSPSFVHKLLKKYRQTGMVNSKPHRGGQSPKLNSEQLNLLEELMEQYSDATLQELCNILEREISVKISRSTMSRITRNIKNNKSKKYTGN